MNENKSVANPLSNHLRNSLRGLEPDTRMILFCIALFLASAWFLAWKIDRDLRFAGDQDSFTIAFESRDSRSLGFFIQNHAADQTFTYKIARDKKIERTDKKFVPQGARESIPLPPIETGGKVSIVVESEGGQRQEIYR